MAKPPKHTPAENPYNTDIVSLLRIVNRFGFPEAMFAGLSAWPADTGDGAEAERTRIVTSKTSLHNNYKSRGYNQCMGKLIILTGTTGVGKTTLARELAKAGDFNLALEQHSERPFQSLFKVDPHYSLANQVDYLLLRAEQERSLRLSPQTGLIDGGLDQDFHGFTCLFHTRGLLNDAEFDLCRRLYTFCRAELPPPDLIIHLTASDEATRWRLAGRDRINIARADDLSLLDSYLDDWLTTLAQGRVVRLDVSSVSPAYTEVIPLLLTRIRSMLGMDAGTYDTGYIP